jgi:hypothetical protein
MACIFSGIVFLAASKAIMCRTGPTEEPSVETVSRGGNYQIFAFKFQRPMH